MTTPSPARYESDDDMKVVTVLGRRRAGIIRVGVPQPKANWVVVKVQAAPMCTEYKAFATGAQESGYGHEAAGEVVAVAQPGRFKVGDRVVAMPLHACGRCRLCIAGDYIHCQDGFDFAALSWQPGRKRDYGAVSAQAGLDAAADSG